MSSAWSNGRLVPRDMSDDELMTQISRFGYRTITWRRKFAGLLGEVSRRGIWRKKGFESIEKFAQLKAGFDKRTTTRILTLAEKLEKFPILEGMFENGEQGWTKFERVMPVVTAETEEYWAEKIRTLTHRALAELVRRVKAQQEAESRAQTGQSELQTPRAAAQTKDGPCPTSTDAAGDAANSASAATDSGDVDGAAGAAAGSPDAAQAASAEATSAEATAGHGTLFDAADAGDCRGRTPVKVLLDPLVAEQLARLAEELNRRAGRSASRKTSLSDAARYALDHLDHDALDLPRYQEVINLDVVTGRRTVRTRFGEQELTQKDMAERQSLGDPINLVKERMVAREAAQAYVTRCKAEGRTPGRYLPAKVERYLYHRSMGGFCEAPDCDARARVTHHAKRHVLDPTPDPDHLLCVCDLDDQLVHAGVFANEDGLPGQLRLKLSTNIDSPEEAARARVDAQVRRHRRWAWKKNDPTGIDLEEDEDEPDEQTLNRDDVLELPDEDEEME